MPEFIPTTGKGGGKKAPFDFGASKNGPAYKAARGGNAIGLTATVADALRRSAEPASAVAYLVQGKPREAAGSIADIVRQKEKVRTIGLSDVPIIRQATGKLPWYLRGPTRFAFDVAGDPLTYLTFGASGVAKGAAGKTIARVGERESMALAAARASTKAARGPESLPRLNDIARAAVLTGVEKGSLDPALQVGLRLPFGRSSVTVAGVNLGRARDALARVGGRIPANEAITKSTRESFLPSRGASKSMRHVHQSVRRAAEVEARLWQREAQDLGRRIYQRAKDNGIKPAKLHELIARSIDNPDRHAIPVFAQDLVADTRSVMHRIDVRELGDGVRRESRPNYVPHILLGDNDVAKLQARYASSVMSKENPFFVKERAAQTFDDLDAIGVKYETNIERLIEARAAASVAHRTKLAIDEATFNAFGVAGPLKPLPKSPAGEMNRKWTEAAAPAFEALQHDYNAKLRAWQAAGSPADGPLRSTVDAARVKLNDARDIYAQGIQEAGVRDADALKEFTARFSEEIAHNQRLQDLPVSRLATSEEWRTLHRAWNEVPDAPRFKDARLPPAIARDLMLVHKTIGDSMKHPAAPLRFLRQVQGSWKRLALATPGFHIRNQLDDSLRAWWAGARNPQSYAQSAGILKGKPGSVTVRGKRYTNDELLSMARSHGVIDVGFVAQEAASSESRHRLRMEAARHGAARRANWLRGTEQLGAFREDWNRMSLFLERLKAGDNPVQAADTVRKYLFDYGDVGEFVTTARRYWVPFITYASKVLPFTAGEFARRPGHMSAIYHAQQGAWEEAGYPDISGLAPEDQLALPLPPQVSALLQRASGARTADGEGAPLMLFNPQGVYGYTMPNDMIEGVRGGWAGSQRLSSSYVSPFITKPIEGFLNYSLYNGRGYRDNELIKANALEALLAKATGGAGFGTKKDQQTGQRNLAINPRLAILTRFLPTANQASSIVTGVPGMQGSSTSPRIGWLKTLGGVPVLSYDRARDEWFARKYGNR